MQQADHIHALKALGDGIDRIGGSTNQGQFKAEKRDIILHSRKDDHLFGCEVYRLRKQHFLRMHLMRRETPHVIFIQDTDMCLVLVEDHQSRLHRRHDIFAFVLIMRR